MPVALAGSLAVLMSAAPANAAEPARSPDAAGPRILASLDGSTAAVRAPSPASVRIPRTEAPDTYDVQAGDTVSAIAARHGLRTTDVLAINGLTWRRPSSTRVSRSAWRPLPPPRHRPHRPRRPPRPPPPQRRTPSPRRHRQLASPRSTASADHGGARRQRPGLVLDHLPGQTIAIPGASAAPAASPAPAPPAAAPAAGGTYVVAAGDTISAIAQMHGVSTRAVLDANGLTASSIIYPGQSIVVPAAATLVRLGEHEPGRFDRPRRRAERERRRHHPGRSRTRGLRPRHRDRAGHRDAGILAAQSRLGRPRLARLVPAAPEHGMGNAGAGSRLRCAPHARLLRRAVGPERIATRGLLDIAGWEDMSFADAAQAVQISAYPERYAQWEQPAYAWLAAHG